MFNKRIEQLQTIARREGIAYFFIAPGANMTYFTGLQMRLSERPTMIMIPASGNPQVYCPSFEALKIKKVTGLEQFITYTDEEGPYETIKRWAKKTQVAVDAKVAFEYRTARLLEYDVILQALPLCKLVDARPLMAELRMVKDKQEIEIMQYCAQLADGMMHAIRKALVPGASENQVRAAAHAALHEAEPDALSGMFIVAAGPNGSNPHSGPSDRLMKIGDMVVVDLGVRYKGYTSDITRTFPIGPISEEAIKVYKIVREANKAGRDFARPGVTCQEVDRVTRRVIDEAGYGQFFTHRTGHGLGMEGHEEPYIVEGNTYLLSPGVSFTIEPGIYIPGEFGVRIEDDVVITADGCQTLTAFPRDLIY